MEIKKIYKSYISQKINFQKYKIIIDRNHEK